MWGLVPPKQSIPSDHWWPRSGTHRQFSVPFQSQLRGCGNRGAVNVAEDKIGPTLALMFHQEQVRRTLKYLLRGTLLAVLPWERRTNFLVLELLSSCCQHFQFRLPLAKCSFLFLRGRKSLLKASQTVSEGFMGSKQLWANNNLMS